MHSLSFYLTLLITIVGLSSALPVETTSLSTDMHNDASLNQARENGDAILNRYFYLINSDFDHLVHALFRLLMSSPTSFPYVPQHALDIALKNMEQKLGRNDVDILTKPFLMAIDQNYQTKLKDQSTVSELTDEAKHKIEEVLDKFFDEERFNVPL